ncbi:MAG: PaaI family thioesterase [Limnohabitans sp.]|nr:MAG: PaaI family thioesterase [Limnohabitans sp.]
MSVEVFGNPDQALIHRFLQQGGGAMPINSNPMAKALQSTLLKVDRERGEVEIGFEPGDLFIQGTGVVQGGAVTAMLDFAMAFATLASLPPQASCVTVNLSTSFLRPAPQGRYIAAGTVDRCGKTLAFTQARLVRADTGQVVATAASSLAVLAPTLK